MVSHITRMCQSNSFELLIFQRAETLGTTAREQAWQYKSTLELDGTPTLGLISTYSGGGYVIDLGTTFDEAVNTVEYLRNTFWLDRTSRAVFTEFNLYNPATNLFTAVELVSKTTHNTFNFKVSS